MRTNGPIALPRKPVTIGAVERTVLASTRMRACWSRAVDVVRSDAVGVIGGTRLELVVALGPAPAVRHEIEVEAGEPQLREQAVVVPIRWRAVGRERLFPRFAGALVLENDADDGARVCLQGSYAVPFGVVGRFGDGLAGRRVARRCMEDLVARIAANLDDAAGIDTDEVGHAYAVSVCEENSPGSSH